MAKLFDFARLIKKYADVFTFQGAVAGGSYKGGQWVPGAPPEPVKLQGAIMPLSEQRVYQSGGTYTTQDRQLYLYRPLPDALDGAKVGYQGHTYSVEQDVDWSAYADVYAYVLRRVSKFEKSAGN
ncbi:MULTISPECIES: hypothetical protein [Caproicibacterium]|uniref:Uncharacterized protein n=1 Tax=Caproicibacterium argilliputei TaxID=3030016 RepID=A0AA97DC99_9FIRM|nr:hypothetical protein [Caproicibacterium argilliputei]WOC33052.1 hypothetical protein PXC00_04010 [Caproicibacterium argilliputei]